MDEVSFTTGPIDEAEDQNSAEQPHARDADKNCGGLDPSHHGQVDRKLSRRPCTSVWRSQAIPAINEGMFVSGVAFMHNFSRGQ